MRFEPRTFQPAGYPWAHFLLTMLVIGGLAAVITLLVLNLRRQPQRIDAPPHDAALNEARMRYARGELTREQYLQISADLGGGSMPPIAPPPPVAQPPAPPPPPVAPPAERGPEPA
jgi:hypothetical protein